MEYIIFCICSIIVARYLEKTSRIASIAHDILFIVLSFAFFFATKNAFISSIVIKVVGQEIYNSLHNAMLDSQQYVKLGFSVLFIVEGTVLIIATAAAIIIFVKSLKNIVKSMKIKTINDIDLSSFKEGTSFTPNKTAYKNNQNTYLLKCSLLN